MKKMIIFSIVLLYFTTTSSANALNNATNDPGVPENNETRATPKIQVALLLDTSSSMDGLIEQAKSCLWNIVNTLTTLKFKGESPQVEISVYEYGNDNISSKNDYIRQVTPLTTDLDLISEKLFALRTNGGSEYCGTVIKRAITELKWGNNESDIKLIYIAGNEPFTQGKITYKSAIDESVGKGIYVNTIHCGREYEGISGMWKDGALCGKGKFFNIDHNRKVAYISTPYDEEITRCNTRLNSTYIGYGRTGLERIENQRMQDKNAESISYANYTDRVVSKSKHAYNNSSWDLIDRVREDSGFLDRVDKKDLPAEFQNKSKEEINKMILEKEKERDEIQKEISELAKKRQQYIESKQTDTGNGQDDLGIAINSSIMELANVRGYSKE